MKKIKNGFRNFMLGATVGMATVMANITPAYAISVDDSTDMGTFTSTMGKIIGIILTVMRYVGAVLVIYGVYEIIMSFMQNQPEAKTKGIFMVAAGVVLVALKSILIGLGVIS